MNNFPDNESHPNGDPPISEKQITSLLRAFRPQPSDRFYQGMVSAPWNTRRRFDLWEKFRLIKAPAILALVLVLVILTTLVSPSVQAFTQRIAQYFAQATSDQVTITVPVKPINTSEVQFSLSVDEAESLAGFKAKFPAFLPEGFTFGGANYKSDRQAIVIDFISTHSGEILRLSQRRVGLDYQSIGASATVEIVQIGDVTGEYVTGAWKILDIQSETQLASPVTLEANWDPDAQIQFLRWQDGDMLYEILYAGGNSNNPNPLDKNDIISLAINLE